MVASRSEQEALRASKSETQEQKEMFPAEDAKELNALKKQIHELKIEAEKNKIFMVKETSVRKKLKEELKSAIELILKAVNEHDRLNIIMQSLDVEKSKLLEEPEIERKVTSQYKALFDNTSMPVEKKEEGDEELFCISDDDELLMSDEEECEEVVQKKPKKKLGCTPSSIVMCLKDKKPRSKKRNSSFTYGSSKKQKTTLDVTGYMADKVREKWDKLKSMQDKMSVD